MNYAQIKPFDISNGIGVRVSLFVSGCRNHCPNCFNKETWDFDYGSRFTMDTAIDIYNMIKPTYIDGLSILGGEPLEPENEKELRVLAKMCHDKPIWLYTGYTFEDVKDLPIMKYIDVLVDGKFIEAQKDMSLAFRGSRNQRIIDVKESLKCGKTILWKGTNDNVY